MINGRSDHFCGSNPIADELRHAMHNIYLVQNKYGNSNRLTIFVHLQNIWKQWKCDLGVSIAIVRFSSDDLFPEFFMPGNIKVNIFLSMDDADKRKNLRNRFCLKIKKM